MLYDKIVKAETDKKKIKSMCKANCFVIRQC